MYKVTRPTTLHRFVNNAIKGDYGTLGPGYQLNSTEIYQGYLIIRYPLGIDDGRDHAVDMNDLQVGGTEPPPSGETTLTVNPGDDQHTTTFTLADGTKVTKKYQNRNTIYYDESLG